MKRSINIWKRLTPLAGLLATACGHDDIVVPDINEEDAPPPYVELRIAMPANASASTRSYPTGGEDGDGRERGVLNEDLIHDINVFFFLEQNGKGMDSPVNTRIIKHIYYNLDNPDDGQNSHLWETTDEDTPEATKPYYENNYLVIKFQCTGEELRQAEQTGINFAAVANAGFIQSASVPTLGALMNYDLSQDSNTWTEKYDAYSKDASNMDYFLMSTAYNDNVKYNGQWTGSNKIAKSGDDYSGTTTLQRMYARLDLWYNAEENAVKTEAPEGSKVKIKELKYTVADTGNEVYLTNVLPVNVMKSPSYLFKKVTNEPFDWTADNTVWNKASLETAGSFRWGGKETPSNFVQESGNDLPTNYVMEPHTLDKASDGLGGNVEDWYGNTGTTKVKENIQKDIPNSDSGNDNGKLSAYYHGVPSSTSIPDYGCDHISIISYANENTHPTDCFHSNYLTGMAFRAVYVPGEIYAELTELTDGDKTKTVLTPMDQDDEPDAIYRYSPSKQSQLEKDCIYFSNREVLEKYQKEHPEDVAEVTEFLPHKHGGKWGLICYYNLWLRHYNDESADPQKTYPMEYATVRNNIYRVKVTFSGPGDPTPTMREPDTMQARIFVRKWNFREEGNPLDF